MADWSAIAPEWAALWGAFTHPVRSAVIEAAGIGPGTRVLDVGCGSGELLAQLLAAGAVPTGLDPAPGMVALASSTGAHVVLGGIDELPFADASFDVVTAFNALQFADDTFDALDELARVTAPGGRIAIANWAEGALNDLNSIEDAVAIAAGDSPTPDGQLRIAGGLESLLTEAGFVVLASGLVPLRWEAPDAPTLLRAVLLGEDAAQVAVLAPHVLAAAEEFRGADGSYVLSLAFRFAVGAVVPPG